MTKMKFHISDILSLAAGQVSLPECPPMDERGNALPARQLPMEGTIQLIEHLTGDKIPRRTNLTTGNLQMDGMKFARLFPDAQATLLAEHSELRNIDVSTLPVNKNQQPPEKLEAMRAARATLEKQYGAYMEVTGAAQKQRYEPPGPADFDPRRN